MRRFSVLHGAIALTVVVVAAMSFTVFRAVRQASDSTRLVSRTQEVLAELEAVLSALVAAENAAVDSQSPASQRLATAVAQAERSAADAVDRVAALTADNPPQQQRIRRLREATTRVFTVLRARVDPTAPAAATVQPGASEQRDLNTARDTVLAMHTEENELLRQRVDSDEAAVDRLEWVATAVGVASIGLVMLVLWFIARELASRQRGTDQLIHDKASLEAEVSERSADLRATAARLQSIIDSAVDAIIVIDATGRVESINRSTERLFGYAAAEVVGQNVSMLMPSPHREAHDSYLARYLQTGEAKIIGVGRQVDGRRRDGTTFPVHLSVGEMAIDGARKFTGILHDLSVRVRFEEQLREQASLVRLGEMAAVLAHEIKNPLAGIRGAIQVIGARLPAASRDSAIIKEIINRVDALNGLMKDLLLFARPPQPRPAVVDLASLVSSTADFLTNDPALNDLRVTVGGAAPPIAADADLLQIVFVNLLVNGAHAMGNRGTIRVSLAVVGSACQIDFIDHGPGIPAELRDKIFTPFFTTKSRGSGLGLPTAKRLIEAHGGSITFACPPEGGTMVSIRLPATAVAS